MDETALEQSRIAKKPAAAGFFSNMSARVCHPEPQGGFGNDQSPTFRDKSVTVPNTPTPNGNGSFWIIRALIVELSGEATTEHEYRQSAALA